MPSAENEQIRILRKDLERRQIKLRSPQKIAGVVNRLLAKRGYAQIQVSEQLLATWQKAAGDRLSQASRVGRFRGGILEIIVSNSSVLQELTFQKKQLIDKLAAELEGVSLKGLRFRVGMID